MTVRWVTGFLDVHVEAFDAAVGFWTEVTAATPSEPGGGSGQLLTLLPADGDACWRMQAVDDGPGGGHLDLHVDDIDSHAERAVDAGARIVSAEDERTVLRSPGGFGVCLVGYLGESRIPPRTVWPGAGSSSLDQLCIDIPPPLFDAEVAFLTAVTGWEISGGRGKEFSRPHTPDGLPVQLLLQRLDSEQGPVRAHPDFATTDATALARRHGAFGAEWVRSTGDWITLTDPAGLPYCLTRRAPGTPAR